MPVDTPVLINIPIDANPIEKTLTATPETPETNESPESDIESDAESAVVNSGAFGCMFFPGIRCNGRIENPKYITKVQKKTHVTENELYISRRIRKKISGYRNYFAPVSKQCRVKMTQKYANSIRKCTLFKDETDDAIDTDPYVSNKIRYLGNETIKTYLFNIASGKVEPGTRIVRPMGELFWDAIIDTHIRLLSGVGLLLSANIIHLDLKYGNIMMEPGKNIPIMIDFGISIDQKALRQNENENENETKQNAFYVYDTYTAWCFDIFLCNYIVQVKQNTSNQATSDTPTKEELESIMEEFQYGPKSKYSKQDKTRNDIFTTSLIGKPVIEQFREKTIANLLSKPTKSWKEIYDQSIQSLYKTWDNYSIAVMYLGILDILKYSKRDAFEQIETVRGESDKSKTILEEYINILESVIYAVPANRPTVKETMDLLINNLRG
jgi:serine/threonine protein kinase